MTTQEGNASQAPCGQDQGRNARPHGLAQSAGASQTRDGPAHRADASHGAGGRSYVSQVISEVRAWDDSRDRSQQPGVGVSQLHGCRSYMAFLLKDEWATEDTDTWRATAGTALHQWLQWVRQETCPGDVSWELEVAYRGVKGHVDEVDWTAGEVTDYKFPSLKSARLWDDPEVLTERMTQVHVYAAAVMASPKWPDPKKRPLVRILVAPVDGTFDDWRAYEEPFDPAVADAAIDRYEAVVHAVNSNLDVPKDKPWYFCQRYCEFFTACRGEREPGDLPEITDAQLAAAVERYGLAGEQASAAEKLQKELRPMILGLRGRARGFRVFLSTPGAGKWEPDLDAINADFTNRGLNVPMRHKPGTKAALYVVREKK